ncbi:TetR/AcrR family transcriptional regulator [Pseudonocardia halophobica]|uniref:TetR/AcrR family transcriptional regulator n=1 Tax=Pseudonocardia halophobica TaxID=29401 RepID=UPI0022F2BD80|nr:TetR family transcriptional regulator [Pseudonocardia halophobica]
MNGDVVVTGPRASRAEATRALILAAAERLFAERGVAAVSNRQIGEAAGQGNTAVVGYHFGAKEDLVRAVVRRHTTRIEGLRAEALAATEGSSDVRDWVDCLVRPMTDYLDGLGPPTWFARFHAQLTTEPAYREIVTQESLSSPALLATAEGLDRCLPDLPAEVRLERGDMTRLLLVHVCAARERALAEGAPTPRTTWDATATGLVDALVGLWLAPAAAPATTEGDRA